MTFSISLNLSGHFAYRYPSDSFTQTLEIRLQWITASSFLESSIGLMSIAFESCNFVASFHCNLWLLTLNHSLFFMRAWQTSCQFILKALISWLSLWLVLLVLAWHCNFDKRSGAFIILTGSSWSKLQATVGISEGPFPRWMVDVPISSFQAALIKCSNIPGERRVCGSVSLAKLIQLLLFSPQKTLYLSHCFLLCNTRWRTLIGHFTQPPYSLATLEASL